MVAAQNIIGLSMDAQSARATVERIQYHLETADHHLESARQLILDLKSSDGWKALGYKSWSACVAGEFGQHRTTIYRQLKAAVIELELLPNGQLGDIPERVLRPLTSRAFDQGTRQAIFALAQEVVSEGGKVTTGVIEDVIEGFKDMLRSGTTQDGDGNQTPLSERMSADLVARVRETRLAHKEHIKRMGKARDYIVGGRKLENVLPVTLNGSAKFSITAALENSLEAEKLYAAMNAGKILYMSLWTED